MKYRNLKKLNINVSSLSFGCMRFPQNGDKINEKETERMIHYAVEKGINYFDTAYPYHNEQSEIVLGKILKRNLRKKVMVATKMPIWLMEKYDDHDKYLDEQLLKLQTDYIDFYLIHGIWSNRWDKVKKINTIKWLENAKKSGKIKYYGFSFHDTFNLFKEILDHYSKWDMCQIQYNYLNEKIQAGTKGLNYAYEKNIPVFVMEPLMGGTLANPPENIKQIILNKNSSPVNIALKWLWNKPQVSSILSGMSSFSQLEENIKYAENAETGILNEKEEKLIFHVQKEFEKLISVPCTACGYCMPCPYGVNIPRIFELYNGKNVNEFLNRALYTWHIKEEEKAVNCRQCGKCEKKCPQKIKISKIMNNIQTENALLFS